MAKVFSSQTRDYVGGDSLGFLIYGIIIAFLKDDFHLKMYGSLFNMQCLR